ARVLIVGERIGRLPGVRGIALDDGISGRWNTWTHSAGKGAGELGDWLKAEGYRALAIGHWLETPTHAFAEVYRFAFLPSISGVWLTPKFSLFEPRSRLEISKRHRFALAHVARGVLAGLPVPKESSFPAQLRARRSVELMVLIRERGRARLWRSARGASLAKALLRAAVQAQQRWHEREHAMGAPLDQLLSKMDVEVSLLIEDGVIGALDPRFVDRVVTPSHGVGVRRAGSWRYELPEMTASGGGGAKTLGRLLREQDLTFATANRPELEVYRFVVRSLSRSIAPGPQNVDPASAPSTGR
ncbi:MAG: hypothetical protein AAF550_06640, partial [Myxococcota bacterium]